MTMNLWQFTFFSTCFLILSCTAEEEKDELKDRAAKLKTAICASPLPSDKVDRLLECDYVATLVGKEIFSQCHMESLSIKSMEEGMRKICAFKGDDFKDYHHKVMRCALEKGKDMARVKEWEEKKKSSSNKEEFKKEKKEMMAKAMSCREQVVGI